jgi:hypothetical protein
MDVVVVGIMSNSSSDPEELFTGKSPMAAA